VQQHLLSVVGNKDLVHKFTPVTLRVQLMRDLLVTSKFLVFI